MFASVPVIVHPSCVQTASIAMNVFASVRATRKRPAVDSTSTAPPTVSSAEPAALTRTADPANVPVSVPSSEGPLPPPPPPPGGVGVGEMGDEPPQAANSDTTVAPDATWQAPAQKRRRETAVHISDIGVSRGQANATPAVDGHRTRPSVPD